MKALVPVLGQRYARASFPRERDPVPIVPENGWIPGIVWTGAENLAPTGIRSPDRPARSESLYLLSYLGPSEGLTFHQRVIAKYKCNDLYCRLPWGMWTHHSPIRLNGNAVGPLSVTGTY
jgi:hypothetical protein